MGLFRRIGRAFRRVTRRVGGFVKKGLSLVTKPLAKVIKPFTGIIGKVLNKLPFGNVITGLLGKFMGSPLAFLAVVSKTNDGVHVEPPATRTAAV